MREPVKSFLPNLSSPSHSPSLWVTLCKEAFFSLPADRGSPHNSGGTALRFCFHPSLCLFDRLSPLLSIKCQSSSRFCGRSSYSFPQRSHSCPHLSYHLYLEKSQIYSPTQTFLQALSLYVQMPS